MLTIVLIIGLVLLLFGGIMIIGLTYYATLKPTKKPLKGGTTYMAIGDSGEEIALEAHVQVSP